MSRIIEQLSISGRGIARLLVFGGVLLVAGCATAPETITKGPLTARPTAASADQTNSGGIYNVAYYRPLFEDRRARLVGDTMTINIVENTSANKDGSNSTSKDGSVDGSIGALFNHNVPNSTFSANSANKYNDKDSAKASNTFSGSIAVTVIEVLPNGYLTVAGEKQIAFDRGTEFVRFSGVVNPDSILQGNVVPSSKVADARIEYRTNSHLDSAQIMSILTRFFLSFIPI